VTVRNDRFLRACRREPVDATPVWFMRQAGRSLPEYRRLRERWSLLEIAGEPDLCAEVTLQPVRRLGVDAAVMFADIMLPLAGMGVDFQLVDGLGPVIGSPIRSAEDVDRLRNVAGEEYAPAVLASIARVVGESPVPVIGFSGAPFTLASYLVEGGPSREFKLVKEFMYREPEAFDRLLDMLARMAGDYLAAQVRAGVAAVQLFDSWAGALSPRDYEQRVLPRTRAVFARLEGLGVPRIHFGTGTAGLLELIATSGCDLVSLDWRIGLDQGWARLGDRLGVQGNLDPAALLAPGESVREQALDVLRRAGGRRGHVFNLGHGVHPETPVENLELLVDLVHAGAQAHV
jgi:uroporphyrinogen decarboxylase